MPQVSWLRDVRVPAVMNLSWRRLIVLRWLYIAACGAGLVINPPSSGLTSGYSILALASAYTVLLYWLDGRRPDQLDWPIPALAGDAALGAVLVAFGADASTAFTFFLFALAVTAAARYGVFPALAMCAPAVALDLATHATDGGITGNTAFRSVFLALAVITTGYLRGLLRSAEVTVQERLHQEETLNRELAAANEQLLHLDELKSQFLANVSHELRTPLTSIRSFSELLLAYPVGDEEAREFTAIINSESERLTRLVNDVLDISKIDSGTMDWHMAEVDVAAVLDEAARIYGPLVAQAGLAFCPPGAPELPPVYADRDRLLQVVGNLLNNALKFTSEGSISLLAEAHDGEVRIAVKDTGTGIALDEQKRVFQRFYQVEPAPEAFRQRGTGLGLTISHDIVTHLGGRIWVQSEPGQGSAFCVALPALPVTSHSAGRQPAL